MLVEYINYTKLENIIYLKQDFFLEPLHFNLFYEELMYIGKNVASFFTIAC